jgi:indole-3-glycerol phosphate synthase
MHSPDGVETDGLAPPVRDLLAAARERRPAAERDRIEVDGRSLEAAFRAARSDGRVPLLAEVKPTSPTTEGHRDLDPARTAEAMVAGGAAGISVLTEPDHFGGSVEALRQVREAVSVPVLRKDFLLEPAQLDAVAADAVLLIARFLDDLAGMVAAARDRGMTPLVETHTRAEVRTAVDAGADVIGVNNRDLGTLTVDRSTVGTVAPAVPEESLLIAESGIETPAHRDRMLEAGADGLLVGSAIVEDEVEATTAELVGR